MSKVTVIYWSGTGNTQTMAEAIAEGAGAKLLEVSAATAEDVAAADVIAFGCSAMGAEVLEEGEFEPFFTSVESSLSGKKVALFGSYGWGDGQWMRDWHERTVATGAQVYDEGLMLNETPDDDGVSQCKQLGEALAKL